MSGHGSYRRVPKPIRAPKLLNPCALVLCRVVRRCTNKNGSCLLDRITRVIQALASRSPFPAATQTTTPFAMAVLIAAFTDITCS